LQAPPRKPLAFAMSASHYVRPANCNAVHCAGKPPGALIFTLQKPPQNGPKSFRQKAAFKRQPFDIYIYTS
jgi:hypothetical protein